MPSVLTKATGATLMMVLVSSATASSPRWFSIKRDPLFADAREQLQVLVDTDGVHVDNRFCIVGERVGGDRQAYVHWLTENRLILWEPQTDNPRAIAGARRNLDLARDVVIGNDVGGSTYRLTRSVANRILQACRRVGIRYRVNRKVAAHA